MINQFKIDSFKQTISSLPDVPELSASELKAAFDSSPAELKDSLNGLIGTLTESTGAQEIGFASVASVHASNVQEAIENVQGQIKNAALGQIPEGSVSLNMLAQEVLTRFEDEEQARSSVQQSLDDFKMEANAAILKEESDRKSACSKLSSDISSARSLANSAQSAANSAARVSVGTYRGTSSGTVTVSVGFRPTAVIVYKDDPSNMSIGSYLTMGFGPSNYIAMTNTGFTITEQRNTGIVWDGMAFHYIAFR